MDMANGINAEMPVKRRSLWFGLLGGAVAWTVHILLAALIAEWGCAGPMPSVALQIEWTVLMLFILTLATLILAVAACFAAYRNWNHFQAHNREQRDVRGSAAFMARAGVLTSGLFVFVILVQSVPILYFLTSC